MDMGHYSINLTYYSVKISDAKDKENIMEQKDMTHLFIWKWQNHYQPLKNQQQKNAGAYHTHTHKESILHSQTKNKPQQDGKRDANMIKPNLIHARWVTQKLENY